MRQVTIIGGGSLGLLFTHLFTERGWDVHLVVRREEQRESLIKEGLTYHRGGEVQTNAVSVTTALPKNREGLFLYAMKYDDLVPLFNDLPQGPKLFIQNGIAHYDALQNEPNCFFATVEHGAKRLGDAQVLHTGEGRIRLATAKDEPKQGDILQSLEELFIIETIEPEQLLLEKVIINSCINPLTALLRVPNGHLVGSISAERAMREVYDELMNVLPSMKKHVPFERVRAVCQQTATNDSSMFVDVQQGRKTELDTIVWPIIERGRLNQIPTPRLHMLYQLLTSLHER